MKRQVVSMPSNLFPMLAVLVSMMGAMILLLLAITRQAQLSREAERAERRRASQARAVAAPSPPPLPARIEYPALPPLPPFVLPPLERKPPPIPVELADPRPPLLARKAALERERETMRQQLANLPQVDWPHLASIAEAINAKRKELADLDAALAKHEQAAERLAREQQRLQREIDEAERSDHVENRYAVVPYVGPNGTRRRPIYFECTATQIVLQPEGVAIVPELLREPQRQPNAMAELTKALAALLRENGADGIPYPLLLVRPDGIAAFYMAQKALQWTDLPLGYELLPADVELTFPPPNAEAKELAETVLARFRARVGRPLARRSSFPMGASTEGTPGGLEVEKSAPGGSGSFGDASRIGDVVRQRTEAWTLRSPNDAPSPNVAHSTSSPAGTTPSRAAVPGPIVNLAPHPLADAVDSHGLGSLGHKSTREFGTASARSGSAPGGDERDAGDPPSNDHGRADVRSATIEPVGTEEHRPTNAGGVPSRTPGTSGGGDLVPSTAADLDSDPNHQPITFDDLLKPTLAAETPSSDHDDEIDWLAEAVERGAVAEFDPLPFRPPAFPREVFIECDRDGWLLHPGEVRVALPSDAATPMALRRLTQHVRQLVGVWQFERPRVAWQPRLIALVRPSGFENYHRLRQALALKGIVIEQQWFYSESRGNAPFERGWHR